MVSAALTTSVPAFNARAVFTWKGDRQYRVYVQEEQLIFIRTSGQQMGQLVAHQFGLIGALVWALTKKRREKKLAAAMQAMDATHPLQLVTQHKHSFQSHRSQLTEQTLEAPSWFKGRGPYAARWRFVVGGKDRMQLELPTKEDVDNMLRLLSPIVGTSLRVDIEWNAKKKKFVRRGN
jgi:hypothetical protein